MSKCVSMACHKGRDFLPVALLLFGLALPNALSHQPVGLKGFVKSIEIKNGEVVDCIDVHQQPAFDHLLLKDHMIQMEPSSYIPKGFKEDTRLPLIFNLWTKGEECPEGTIPVLRTPKEQIERWPRKGSPFTVDRGNVHISSYQAPGGYEYTAISTNHGNYYGAHAILNVWHPKNNPGENSIAQIWLASGGHGTTLLSTIEAGWTVFADPSLSTETRLFIYWTLYDIFKADSYEHTGCYNLHCAGFVQVDRRILLGGPLRPVSVYGGPQFEMEITIVKDNATDNWWLRVDGTDVGYWPSNIFNYTRMDKADRAVWGGEINNFPPPGGHHTRTQMGSGHLADEGFTRSSYFKDVRATTQPGSSPVYNIGLIVTKPACYNLKNISSPESGLRFYFGGPGYSGHCQY